MRKCYHFGFISLIHLLSSPHTLEKLTLVAGILSLMVLLFTGHNGEVFKVAPEDVPSPAPLKAYTSFDGASPADPVTEIQQSAAMMKPSPLIIVSNMSSAPDEHLAPLPTKKVISKRKRFVSDNSGNNSGLDPPKITLIYNDYGELVDAEKLKRPVNSAELTVTETMRLIYKAYYYKVSPIQECCKVPTKENTETFNTCSFA